MDAVGLNITVWGGLVLGVFLGAFVSVVVARRFQWAMPTGAQMLRNVADGVMMAWGGILTMGCSIGHGIGHGMAWHGMAGVATLSVSSFIAVTSMVLGAWVANRLLTRVAGSRMAQA